MASSCDRGQVPFSASVVARRVESRITIHALNAGVSEAVHAEVVLSLLLAMRTASLRAPLREIPALVAGDGKRSDVLAVQVLKSMRGDAFG